MMARRIATYAATVKVNMTEAGQDPTQLANIRCKKAYEYFKDGTPNGKKFLGYTKIARQRFLAELEQGAKDMSELDTSVHTRRGTGNGCYYEYSDDTKVLKLNILIEGRDGDDVKDGNWPVFARGILPFFKKKPVTLYGRASYTAEGTGTGVHGYHTLEHKIGRSLKAYGVTAQKLVGRSGEETQLQSGEITALKEGDEDNERVVGFGDPSTRTDGGRTFGMVKMPVDDPSGEKLPLVLSTAVYKWRAQIAGHCADDILDKDKWNRKSATGFKWKISPSEFVDLDQEKVNLLPCWSSQCNAPFSNKNTKSGRYAYIQDYPKYYFPIGKDKTYKDKATNQDVTYYFARSTNLDGNNHPITMKKGGSGETSEDVKLTCAFSRMQHNIQQGKGNEATIRTVIDTTNDTHGKPPENKPLRKSCPSKIKHGVAAQADFGPYKELQAGCDRITENWDKVIKYQEENSRYQNPLDRFLPYYKYAETCPTGTPQCGFFGISRLDAFTTAMKKKWYYQYQGDQVPQVVFDMQTRLLTNSTYTRQHNRVSLECKYRRHVALQHCCRGINDTWCENEHSTPKHVRPVMCNGKPKLFGSGSSFPGVVKYHVVPEKKTLADHTRDGINDRGTMKDKTCCEARCDNDGKCGMQDPESKNFQKASDTCPWGVDKYLAPLPTDKKLVFTNCSDNTATQEFGAGDSKSDDPDGRCQAINTN